MFTPWTNNRRPWPFILVHVVDRGDEITHGAFSIFIEHAKANELALRRHPADAIELGLLVFDVLAVLLQITRYGDRPLFRHGRVCGYRPFTCDDSGYMRAVTVLVVERIVSIHCKILMPP